MTAAVLYGKEDVKIESVPIPEIGEGEVLVKVEVALTDGTDLKVFQRGYHARMIQPPALFGHELAGVVAEAGPGVFDFRKGMRVVALNSAPCGSCFYCRKHQENLCEDLLFNNGAYAEYIRIPRRIVEKNMLAIPDGVSFEAAAMTEPLACVVRGLEQTGAAVGDHVAVIGAGPIGLSFIQVAALSGCHVITKVRDAIAATKVLTPGECGPDVVVEATGRPQGWEWAVEMVRRGGVVNFFGGPPAGTRVSLDTNRLHYSEITLLSSFHHTPETVRKAFKLIVEQKIRSADYVTGEEPLSRLQQVLQQMLNRGSIIKTAIIPGH
jgi:L-iditol 2-dehydrogenase